MRILKINYWNSSEIIIKKYAFKKLETLKGMNF